MSKDCIKFCPRIAESVRDYNPDCAPDIAAVPILQDCAASYECEGPSFETRITNVGIFRQKYTEVEVAICGLDKVASLPDSTN